MKLQQRYVILFVIFVLAVVSVNLYLTVSSKPSLFNAVQGLPDVIKKRFLAGSQLEPNKFVRQLTAEEFRENPAYKTGIVFVAFESYISILDMGISMPVSYTHLTLPTNAEV